jgi:PIN domain nuclease of toxin-antitoxin system
MRWYTARWEVAEVQRLHTLLRSLCEESETEFIMADRESRWLLDILVERQTLPATTAQAEYTAATCDNAKKSLLRADAELAMINGLTTVQ